LYRFFSGFGIPAFTEYNVPDDAVLPYITYQVNEPGWNNIGTIYARVWYRSTSFTSINAKVDQIKASVGEGVSIPTSGGAVYLTKGTPFAQNIPIEGDETLKVVYLLFNIQTPTI
jgi:hypothetical protein